MKTKMFSEEKHKIDEVDSRIFVRKQNKKQPITKRLDPISERTKFRDNN